MHDITNTCHNLFATKQESHSIKTWQRCFTIPGDTCRDVNGKGDEEYFGTTM